jgi:hypothetical protein
MPRWDDISAPVAAEDLHSVIHHKPFCWQEDGQPAAPFSPQNYPAGFLLQKRIVCDGR